MQLYSGHIKYKPVNSDIYVPVNFHCDMNGNRQSSHIMGQVNAEDKQPIAEMIRDYVLNHADKCVKLNVREETIDELFRKYTGRDLYLALCRLGM